MDILIPLVLMAVIAGFVVLGVGLSVFQKWANSRIASGGTAEQWALMEDRLAELEERLDFTERALTDLQARAHLEPGDAPSSSEH